MIKIRCKLLKQTSTRSKNGSQETKRNHATLRGEGSFVPPGRSTSGAPRRNFASLRLETKATGGETGRISRHCFYGKGRGTSGFWTDIGFLD